MRRAIAAAVLTALLVSGSARADQPEPKHLVLTGLGFALPTYAIGVVVHEGSHALAAELVGADVVELRLLPGVHPPMPTSASRCWRPASGSTSRRTSRRSGGRATS